MTTTRGRFGVTRDADGTLSTLFEWPWYWRYPSGALLIVGGVLWWLWTSQDGNQGWASIALPCLAVLSGLAVAYELGCLTVVVAVIGGLWLASDAFLPDYEVPMPVRIWIGIFAGIWAINYAAKQAAQAVADIRADVANARAEARQQAEVTNSLIQRLHNAVVRANRQNDWDE